MNRPNMRRYLIGDDLVSLRRKIGWSQEAVAKYLRLDHASQLSKIENGFRWITYDEEALLQELEAAFDRGELQNGRLPM
jgi:transcriptional regulator with XRE-family HTH domain